MPAEFWKQGSDSYDVASAFCWYLVTVEKQITSNCFTLNNQFIKYFK